MQPLKRRVIRIIATLFVSSAAFAADVNSRQPVARIGTEAVYEDDLLPSIGAPLWQLRTQEYELKSRALENVLNQRVLETEAKSKGLSAEALLTQEVDQKIPTPTASETEAYYLAQKTQVNRPFADVKAQIEAALREAKRQQARQEYIEGLRKKAGVAVLLSRPRMEVSADLARLRGNADAPVTIVEFSDFECPYCGAAQATIKQILAKYPDKVRLSYRDFPLRQIHAQAQQAAEAARCAGQQQKFWEYHDLLYANQGTLSQAGLIEHARTAGLDVENFSSCLASGKFKALVESDLQAGMRYGVSGTPAFYVNGVPLSGNQPVSEFERIINAEIAAAQTSGSALASRK